MDLKDTKIEIAPLPFDERGQKLEPEERPAKITQDGSAPTMLGGVQTVGSLPISIEQHLTAGAVAATVRDPCGTCKHFDRSAWHKHVRFLQSSYAGKQMLNNIMAELLVTQNISVQDLHDDGSGEFDTLHAVQSMGVCRVLSEAHNDLVAVHPLGVCPPEMRSIQAPRGAYVSRDSDTDRAGSVAFDAVMRAAQKIL